MIGTVDEKELNKELRVLQYVKGKMMLMLLMILWERIFGLVVNA